MITLTSAQQDALDALQEFAIGKTPHGVATLSGFAGVGRPPSSPSSARAHRAMGFLRILVTAPTHKALAVLAAKLGSHVCDAMTTQAALGLRLTELESGEHRLSRDGSPRLAEYDLAIIDEASMVSDDLFSAILASRRDAGCCSSGIRRSWLQSAPTPESGVRHRLVPSRCASRRSSARPRIIHPSGCPSFCAR